MTRQNSTAREPERSETVALLALLRAAPKRTRWSDIAQEVRLAGSAPGTPRPRAWMWPGARPGCWRSGG
jgi:hypothetical protein